MRLALKHPRVERGQPRRRCNRDAVSTNLKLLKEPCCEARTSSTESKNKLMSLPSERHSSILNWLLKGKCHTKRAKD